MHFLLNIKISKILDRFSSGYVMSSCVRHPNKKTVETNMHLHACIYTRIQRQS
jgi:hypothetical protein